MELITARKGTPHITPMQDAMWHMGLTELESCVFDAFENFKADIITANEIRVRSGVGMIQGRFFEIPQNTYDPATIMNGTQGEKRIDLIVCRVTVNESENTQKAETVVIQGTPTAGTPQAPAPITGDLDNGDTVADYPLYAVNISGITITSVTPQFETGWLVSAETVQMFADAGYPMADRKVDKALQQTVAMYLDIEGSKAEIDLLWQNASPTSAFAAQTIPLDLSGYDLALIVMRGWASSSSYWDISNIVKVGSRGSAEYILNLHTDGATKYFVGRLYEVSNTGVAFQASSSCSVGASAIDHTNRYITPYQVYGIKI